MGYDLHITQKQHWWDDTGPIIDESEWRRIVEEDPELSIDPEAGSATPEGKFVFADWKGEQGVLWWRAGEIVTKNPDELLIAKLVQIARKLGATVQGDDGESYREDGSSFWPSGSSTPSSPAPHRASVVNRIARWLRDWRTTRQLQQAAPRFQVGDRVRDSWGNLGTVLEVDRRANHGLGSVKVRFDDGREVKSAYVASGLEIVSRKTAK